MICDLPLMHKEDVRAAGHIGMDGHREDKLVVFLVEVVEVVLIKGERDLGHTGSLMLLSVPSRYLRYP
jgi:hypothetical protein